MNDPSFQSQVWATFHNVSHMLVLTQTPDVHITCDSDSHIMMQLGVEIKLADMVQVDMQQLSMDMTLDLVNFPKYGGDRRLNREGLQAAISDESFNGPNAWPTMIPGWSFMWPPDMTNIKRFIISLGDWGESSNTLKSQEARVICIYLSNN